jgi:hypothetical protein
MTDQGFNELFHRLVTTRHRYEQVRMGNGDLGERSHLLDELHDLRAQIAIIRAAR